ncbi:hypothetical protein BABINDRAFT_14672 [Babjeviella inositovora NRRL Y-12698]|uniref:Uncharacterized protein n=1 Tax=Babjeviella inositovora NRRL Y-12698 TaxID=984486 RepID=A0A1E3QLD8_9ASCO|nr:uncharacterized protein BABINDRAFT_14672 [Babjeviella inositovora NRRL Y-12698]ODQ78519.1 hypothetical protein BABINDRAFT_14672 [Babjeviella inositovora NRRL Y-12698]
MSVGSSFISINDDIPLGYSVPPFPSLHWPLAGENAYSQAFLFYKNDIWRFTLIWTLIFFGVFYLCAGVVAAIGHRRLIGSLSILVTYIVLGGVQAAMSGTVAGFVLGTSYEAGSFKMSTWLPMVCGLVQIVYVIVTSYSITSLLL